MSTALSGIVQKLKEKNKKSFGGIPLVTME
jgi:hypothetical protein